MADATSLLAVQRSVASNHHGTAYSQRMMPDSPALLALFRSRPPPHEPQNVNLRRKPATSSCLRKISAYNGGFRVSDDDTDVFGADASRFVKKRLSFADQHGGQLALEREFHARDAPIYCSSAVTRSLPVTTAPYQPHRGDRWRDSTASLIQRLVRGVQGVGGRDGEEHTSGWTQPKLVSLCVVSCSVVGCVAFTYARLGPTSK